MVDLDPQEELSLDPETHELVTKRFVEFLSAQAGPATPLHAADPNPLHHAVQLPCLSSTCCAWRSRQRIQPRWGRRRKHGPTDACCVLRSASAVELPSCVSLLQDYGFDGSFDFLRQDLRKVGICNVIAHANC